MNPHDMRELFDDVLAKSPPPPAADTDGIIAAGKRSRRRRRAAQAGSGALAAVAVLALAASAPALLRQADNTPQAGDSSSEATERPGGDCPEPVGALTEEQVDTAATYGRALEEYLAGLGGEVANSCFEGAPEHHGFYYDAELDGYRFNESVDFPATGEWAQLIVSVHPPVGGPLDERMEELTVCDELELDCRWSEIPGGTLLLVEDYAKVLLDEGDRTAVEFDPVDGALLGLADGTIVEVEMGVSGEGGTLRATVEQLGELAAAIPVGEESTGAEDSADEESPEGDGASMPGEEESTSEGGQGTMPEEDEEAASGVDEEPLADDEAAAVARE